MPSAAESLPSRAHATESFHLTLLWIVGGILALVVGLAPLSASLLNGHYTPIGPDAFYHARRILDAAADPASFFQFDTHTDAPNGGLVLWPWAYDYVMSLIVRGITALGLSSNPMAVLVHIPPIASAFTIGIVLALCRGLRLSLAATAIAILCTALFPMSQGLYSIGNIDHHFAEHMFVLGSLASAILWLQRPESRGRAAIAGVVLGLAPGIHTAQFILQVPLLATFALLWLRGQPRPATTLTFSLALIVATLVVALPSLPLRQGHFDYYTLSWFQVYVAACTAILSVLLARTQANTRGIIVLGLTGSTMLVPILGQVALAREFFAVSIEGMGAISEVKSPLRLWQQSGSIIYFLSNYTGLFLLTPATAALCLWKIWRERDPARSVFWIASLAGLALLVMQLRLHYFGSFALYLPWLLLLEDWLRKGTLKPVFAWGACAAVVVFSYLPGITGHLFAPQAAAGDPYYELTQPIYAAFAQACREKPGIVLAEPNDGHYIRFNTNCSVIANNFLVTQQQAERTREERALLGLPAKDVLTRAPAVRYVYVRRSSLFYSGSDGRLRFAPDGVPGYPEPALVDELLSADKNALPEHYRMIVELVANGGTRPYARLFAVDH
jgi:hypothetical protein